MNERYDDTARKILKQIALHIEQVWDALGPCSKEIEPRHQISSSQGGAKHSPSRAIRSL